MSPPRPSVAAPVPSPARPIARSPSPTRMRPLPPFAPSSQTERWRRSTPCPRPRHRYHPHRAPPRKHLHQSAAAARAATHRERDEPLIVRRRARAEPSAPELPTFAEPDEKMAPHPFAPEFADRIVMVPLDVAVPARRHHHHPARVHRAPPRASTVRRYRPRRCPPSAQ